MKQREYHVWLFVDWSLADSGLTTGFFVLALKWFFFFFCLWSEFVNLETVNFNFNVLLIVEKNIFLIEKISLKKTTNSIKVWVQLNKSSNEI